VRAWETKAGSFLGSWRISCLSKRASEAEKTIEGKAVRQGAGL